MTVRRVVMSAALVGAVAAGQGVSVGSTAPLAPTAGQLAARAAVASGWESGRVLALGTYRSARLSVRQSVLTRQAGLLVRARVPKALVLAASGASLPSDSSESLSVSATGTAVAVASVLEPVGDLNRNGTRDVVDVRYGKQDTHGTTPVVVLAREGGTGAVLWSRTLTVAKDHVAIPVGATTGRARRAGIVLIDLGLSTSSDTKTLTESLALNGWDAAGKSLWSHRESGTVSFAGSAPAQTHLPALVGIVRATHSGQDLLMTRTDSGTDSTGQDTSSVTPVRVNTTVGALAGVGPAVSTTGGTTDVIPAGDLNGDALDDIALVSPGSPGVVQARAALDGHALWSNTGLTLYDGADAEPVGDVHPSGTGLAAAPDLAVATGLPPTTQPVAPALPIANPLAPTHGQVALLDGAAGSTVWSKTGDEPYAVTHAGPQLLSATGVLTSDTTTSNGTTTQTLTLTTYDDTATQVYSHAYTLSAPDSSSSQDPSFGGGFAFPVGDFEPDTAQDGLAVLFLASSSGSSTKQVLFHGNDGSPVSDDTAEPLGASTTGHGDDLVRITTRRGVTIDVRSGRTGRSRFSTTLPNSTAITAAAAYGSTLTSTRCADIVVLGFAKNAAISAILASNGQVRWALRYTPGSTRPGTVQRPRTAPHPRCG